MKTRWMALALFCSACPGSDDTPATQTTAATDPGGVTGDGDVAADTTGGGGCLDSYELHATPQTALPLNLDTSDTAMIVLGDGFVAAPVEIGADELRVCATSPSDYFTITLQCPSFVAVEVRRLGGGAAPDLDLYGDKGLLRALQGTWHGFFLKPYEALLQPGDYMIGVTQAGFEVQDYTLTVAVLPRTGCL